MDNSSESSMREFDKLAERIATQWYAGKLPRCPAAIAEVLMKTIPDAELPKVPAEVLEEGKKRFADALLAALNDRIRAQDAADSQFKN